MKDIRGLLKANGLERIANIVQGAVKPSVRLTSAGTSEVAGTRLGGRPNLPPDIEWPHWKEKPLAFLAQIDLSILPALEPGTKGFSTWPGTYRISRKQPNVRL